MANVTRADVLSYLENSNMLEISELIGDIEEIDNQMNILKLKR